MLEVLEIFVALGFLGTLVGVAALITWVSWWWLFGVGMILMVLGLLVGVLVGVWYHVRLYWLLASRQKLARVWWLNPTGLYVVLDAVDKWFIRAPFVFGAVGFVAAILGCVLFVVGVWFS